MPGLAMALQHRIGCLARSHWPALKSCQAQEVQRPRGRALSRRKAPHMACLSPCTVRFVAPTPWT